MLARLAESDLKKWIKKKNRKPLILRGARQVGKSTLVRLFAKNNNYILHEINLEKHLYLNKIFKTLDIPLIIRELEAVIGINILGKNAVIFLDEIQATPYALQALRYFYEERPQLAVISAGSLLEFTLSDHSFSMPVGRVEYYHLGPMTFKEYLISIESPLERCLSDFSLETGIPNAAHKKLLSRQREYLFIGGMPEAVHTFCHDGSITDVTDVHRSIADTYQDDFSKYARNRELALLQQIFRYIPRTIGQKIKYSNISREQRSGDIKAAIELFSKAGICHKIYHSHCSGIPLFADIREKTYKLLFMDIGMVNHICGNDWITIQSFENTRLVNEGSLAEQFIGQHLIRNKKHAPGLCYWLREVKTANAEVDYVISHGPLILPVEVKAGKSGVLKSLQQFVIHKRPEYAVRFDLNPPGLQDVSHKTSTLKGVESIEFKLLSLPLYMVEELPRIIDLLRQGNTMLQ